MPRWADTCAAVDLPPSTSWIIVTVVVLCFASMSNVTVMAGWFISTVFSYPCWRVEIDDRRRLRAGLLPAWWKSGSKLKLQGK